MKTDVTAFGEILIDFTDAGKDERGTRLFAAHPGGAPANVAVGVARLGAKSAFIGKIGDDFHGEMLRKVLEDNNVDTSGLLSDESVFTTLAFVQVDENGERTFSFARKPGADTRISWEEIEEKQIENSKIFHTGSLSLTHEPAASATRKALEAAKKAGVIVSYDPNYRASLWKDEKTAVEAMRSLIPCADLMKISDEETALLTDQPNPIDAARALIDQGVKIVAVTLGAEGSLIANREGYRVVPGFKSTVADTNGAGDSFWAAMLSRIAASGKQPEELCLDELEAFVRYANGAATLTVRKPGAIPAMPTHDEVEALLEKE